MAYTRFGKDLRNVICAFYEDGVICKKPSKKFIRNELTEDRIALLRKLVRLVMFTEYTDEYTKVYLSNYTLSYKDVADMMNVESIIGGELTDKQVKGKVWHRIDKLKRDIGEESIMRITMYRNNDVSHIEELIDNLLKEYADGIQSNFEVSIMGTGFNQVLSNKDFEEFVQLIKPYSKSNIELVQRAISEDMKDYVNYLVCNEENLTTEELERLNILKDL